MFSLRVDDDIKLVLLEKRHAQRLFSIIDANHMYLNERLKWTASILSLVDAEHFIEKSFQQFANGTGFDAGIFYRGELVGILSLIDVDHSTRSAAFAYWLAEAQQKKGIMRRACAFLENYCFNELNLHRLVIRVEVDNDKSHAIPAALGFIREGILRDSHWLHDHFIDVVVYSKLSTDLHK